MATDGWLARAQRARFRGFEFLTDGHDARSGRRLVVHEYPGADDPLVEDLGGKAWDWKLNAYFIGPDYDLERNGFLAKLAEPGADWMTHPWLGYLWVRPSSWSVTESNERGGYCTIAIEFVPGGEQPFTAEADRVDVAFDRIGAFSDAALGDFSLAPMSAAGFASFVAAVQGKLDILRNVLSLATLPLTWASQVINLVAGVKADVAALVAVPRAYASAWRSLSNVIGSGPDDVDDDIPDTNRPRVIRRLLAVGPATAAVKVPGVAATDGAVQRNLRAEQDLRGRLLIAAAAQVALADYRAAEDRDTALAAVLTAIDGALPAMNDTLFQAAVSMRVALIDALLAQDLNPTVQRDVVAPLPATLLAYRMGVDEDVLLTRNRVRHPLFVRGRLYG